MEMTTWNDRPDSSGAPGAGPVLRRRPAASSRQRRHSAPLRPIAIPWAVTAALLASSCSTFRSEAGAPTPGRPSRPVQPAPIASVYPAYDYTNTYWSAESYRDDDRFVTYQAWSADSNKYTYTWYPASRNFRITGFQDANHSFRLTDRGSSAWHDGIYVIDRHSDWWITNDDDNDPARDAAAEQQEMPPVYHDASYVPTTVSYSLLAARDREESATFDFQDATRHWWGSLPQDQKTRNGEPTIRSNNNVAAIRYHDRYYVAIRTSAIHWAMDLPGGDYNIDSDDWSSCAPGKTGDLSACNVTHLLVFSAPAPATPADGVNAGQWRVETNVWLNRDVREPQFLITSDPAYGESLKLYFFAGGRKRFDWEVEYTYYVEKRGPTAVWSSPRKLDTSNRPAEYFEKYVEWSKGYIAWRIKTVVHSQHNGGRPLHYMLRYKGTHYDFTNPDGTPNTTPNTRIEFVASENGVNWFPVRDLYVTPRIQTTSTNPVDRIAAAVLQTTERATVYQGGGSEADFAFDRAGDLYSVIRVEDYDVLPGHSPGGSSEPSISNKRSMGSRICRAPKANIADWKCVHSPFRLDSPVVFSPGYPIYVVARRSIWPEERQEGYKDYKERKVPYLASFPVEVHSSDDMRLWNEYSENAPTAFNVAAGLGLPFSDEKGLSERTAVEQANALYWLVNPKRTSLYRIDRARLENLLQVGNLAPCDYESLRMTYDKQSLRWTPSGAVPTTVPAMKVLPERAHECEQELPIEVITDFVGVTAHVR